MYCEPEWQFESVTTSLEVLTRRNPTASSTHGQTRCRRHIAQLWCSLLEKGGAAARSPRMTLIERLEFLFVGHRGRLRCVSHVAEQLERRIWERGESVDTGHMT